MVNYDYIFTENQKFRIVNSYIDEIYQFQPNETKGEFINEKGQVVAQLVEASPDSDWFSVAGIFMGQINIIGLQYSKLTPENHMPINLSW